MHHEYNIIKKLDHVILFVVYLVLSKIKNYADFDLPHGIGYNHIWYLVSYHVTLDFKEDHLSIWVVKM